MEWGAIIPDFENIFEKFQLTSLRFDQFMTCNDDDIFLNVSALGNPFKTQK